MTQSPTSKLRLQDEAVILANTAIINDLKEFRICKITGDNLDIYVRTGEQSTISGMFHNDDDNNNNNTFILDST